LFGEKKGKTLSHEERGKRVKKMLLRRTAVPEKKHHQYERKSALKDFLGVFLCLSINVRKKKKGGVQVKNKKGKGSIGATRRQRRRKNGRSQHNNGRKDCIRSQAPKGALQMPEHHCKKGKNPVGERGKNKRGPPPNLQ